MKRKEILTNSAINKCTLNSIITHHNTNTRKYAKLEMWANAQRDGRPAEYWWRRLFNAAVLLTPTTRLPCSNAAKTRNPLKFAFDRTKPATQKCAFGRPSLCDHHSS